MAKRISSNMQSNWLQMNNVWMVDETSIRPSDLVLSAKSRRLTVDAKGTKSDYSSRGNCGQRTSKAGRNMEVPRLNPELFRDNLICRSEDEAAVSQLYRANPDSHEWPSYWFSAEAKEQERSFLTKKELDLAQNMAAMVTKSSKNVFNLLKNFNTY